MIILLIFLGLIIYLIIEIIRYCKIKANIVSRDEVKKAAEEQARNLKIKDPIISCDYCGAKIDTKIHKVCPQCGGAFDKDIEWTSKFNIKSSFINEQTKEIINQTELQAQEKSKNTLKHIKITIIVLVSIIAFSLAGALWLTFFYSSLHTRGSETLEKKYTNYTKADYSIEGDGIICDNDDFKLALKGIYTNNRNYSDDSSYYGGFVLEFELENRTDKNVNVHLSCCGNSGMARAANSFFYDTFKKNCKVTLFEPFYFEGDSDQISELVFNELEVRTANRYDEIYELKEPVTIHTTSDFRYTPDTEGLKLTFSNNLVDIYSLYKKDDYDEGYVFTIINKTDKNFIISSDDFMVNGEVLDSTLIYKETLPGNYFFVSRPLRVINSDYEDITAEDVKVNINFDCKEDPSLNFATGYMDLNK